MKLSIHIIVYTYLLLSIGTTAQTTLINFESEWKYYDAGNAPPVQAMLTWKDANYLDISWSNGIAQLGYGDGDESTVINDNAITAYFRHSFNVTNASVYDFLDLDLIYDDGAVVYLNGEEIWRINMPSGIVAYNTFSNAQSSDNARVGINASNKLIDGQNVIAVEVHQRSNSSSDISFDFKLSGIRLDQVNVTRGPYLQKSSPLSMTIKWRTSPPTQSVIHYGRSMSNLDQTVSDLELKTEHEIEITGLNPSSKYYYNVSNLSEVLVPGTPDLYFKTSPLEGSSQTVRAWVLGDCGTATNNQRNVRDAYYNHIGSTHTDLILFLGDNAYISGTDDEYQYALFEDMYEDKLKNTVSWSCLGNHDGRTANSSNQTGPDYDIFSFPKSGEAGGLASGTEAYYSFNYGNIHFISLDSYDSERDIDEPMYNWCEADIQNTTADWIVAFWHHPAYSKGSHDSDTESQLVEMRENFLPMLERNGVDLVLSGHSHSYERSYFINGHYGESESFNMDIHAVGPTGSGNGKIDGDGAYEKVVSNSLPDKGAVYITAGSSGKISSGDLDHEAMYYSVSELGSCILEVENDTMHVKFLRETGAVEDYFSIIKTYDPSTSVETEKELIVHSGKHNKLKEITAFPNPSRNKIMIDATELVGMPFELELFDANGKTLYRQYFKSDHESVIEIPVTGFEPGIYVIKLSDINHSYRNRKIVVVE